MDVPIEAAEEVLADDDTSSVESSLDLAKLMTAYLPKRGKPFNLSSSTG